eukprot:GHUV01055820.1.p1 GENE.GHUV01055820.1~~GHUV01055820.1.p1  ORF type:complete len:106 (+),score=11.06 GHUV01055820.1:256-573(+)
MILHLHTRMSVYTVTVRDECQYESGCKMFLSPGTAPGIRLQLSVEVHSLLQIGRHAALTCRQMHSTSAVPYLLVCLTVGSIQLLTGLACFQYSRLLVSIINTNYQ